MNNRYEVQTYTLYDSWVNTWSVIEEAEDNIFTDVPIDQNSQNGSCVLTGVTSGFIADPISDLSTQFTPPYRFVYP